MRICNNNPLMGDYCIKDGYQHRAVNATMETTAGDYWDPKRLVLSHYAQWHAYRRAADLVRDHGLKTVLDVGCGVGHKLMNMIAPITEVTGVEQPTAAAKAKEFFPQGRFVSADLERPDKTGLGTFDLLLCVDVVEHLLDPDVLLRFLRSHCHDGSYLLISTIERDVRRGKANMKSTKAEHVREWNRDEFGRYLTSQGFEVVEHRNRPAFKMGLWMPLIKDRIRLLRKFVSINYSQVAVCRPAGRG